MRITNISAKSRNSSAKPQRFLPGSGRHLEQWKNSFAPLEDQIVATRLENGLNALIPEVTGANLTTLKLNDISRRALGALSNRLPFLEAPSASSAVNSEQQSIRRVGSPCTIQKTTLFQKKQAPLIHSRDISSSGCPNKIRSPILRSETLSKIQRNMSLGANRTILGVRKPSSYNLDSFTRRREEVFPKNGPLNFQKPSDFNTDNIMIISNNHTDKLWDCYNAHGLFGKWFDYGVPSSKIQQWLKSFTGNQISIMSLENDFLFINCNTADLKDNLLKNNQRFFKGYCFKFFNWKPNFSPKDVEKIRVPKWIRFPNMPVELIHNEVLKKLGEFLGGFEGLEDNYLESFDIKILANIEIGKSTFDPIKIITNHSIYEIKPETTVNDFIPRTCISSDQG
ncbi:hypothetical protein SUGI_0150600 [Cryptomeria japonica]|nr:hypothetical protein SUGI_0150600 [Cryptomeria japonica]